MGEELGYMRVRMHISGAFNNLITGNRIVDIWNRDTIKYSSKFEIHDMGCGVILIKEPSIELITDRDLTSMGFGC